MGEKTQCIQQYKVDAVNKLKQAIEGSKDIVFTDFRGLNVEKITELRTKLYEQDSVLKVAKNNFIKLAFKSYDLPDIQDIIKGPIALALINRDTSQILKILFDYAKNESFAVRGGIVDGRRFSPENLETLSRLPGKTQLIGMLMSAMIGPVRNLLYTMNGVTQKLVLTLKAIADKKEGEKGE
ncbi:MAG: 50S ribosomal protein L10 [Spirochaetales bacterium]|nr:50S ribosomal protein L10 [Spirochaetales bacterium]